MPKSKKEGKYYEVRLYKSHDADLLSLWADGVKVSKLLKQSMENYVHRKNIKYRIPECRMHRLDGSGVIRYHLLLTDPEVIALLERVRKGRRNQFFKNVLREALLTEPMGGYFLYEQDAGNETKRLQNLSKPEIIDLSAYVKTGNSKKRTFQKKNDAEQVSDEKKTIEQTGHQDAAVENLEEARMTAATEFRQKTGSAAPIEEKTDIQDITHQESTRSKPQMESNKETEEEDILLSMFDNLSGQI